GRARTLSTRLDSSACLRRARAGDHPRPGCRSGGCGGVRGGVAAGHALAVVPAVALDPREAAGVVTARAAGVGLLAVDAVGVQRLDVPEAACEVVVIGQARGDPQASAEAEPLVRERCPLRGREKPDDDLHGRPGAGVLARGDPLEDLASVRPVDGLHAHPRGRLVAAEQRERVIDLVGQLGVPSLRARDLILSPLHPVEDGAERLLEAGDDLGCGLGLGDVEHDALPRAIGLVDLTCTNIGEGSDNVNPVGSDRLRSPPGAALGHENAGRGLPLAPLGRTAASAAGTGQVRVSSNQTS
ncbi:unnamed protein product, partial [Penicillium discolor]